MSDKENVSEEEVEVVQYQCREIGETGWEDCGSEGYNYCNRSALHDTRTLMTVAQHQRITEALRDDDRAAIHQLAFELGGTEGGEYLLDLDDLNAVIDAAYQRQQARKVVAPDAEGSAAQKSFWAGFESAALRLFGTNIRAAWNSYKASDEFARLNKGAGSHE